MYTTPILFLAFNRPEETKRSFQKIREIKPRKLYISQDGPRNKVEETLTKKVKEIFTEIDWNCEVFYKISDDNLGCKNAVNSAIDWFFENEDMGVIIEDDILPDTSFFAFIEAMLHKYAQDERIMLVTGNNLLGEYSGQSDYFFSKIGSIWGWGTWRRVWNIHDQKMKNWPQIKTNGDLHKYLPKAIADYREKCCDNVYEGKINTWDYQFTLTRIVNQGLTIIPRLNLIQNIGFSESATHTKSQPNSFDNVAQKLPYNNINHPKSVTPDSEFDLKLFYHFNPKPNLLSRAKNKILRLKYWGS